MLKSPLNDYITPNNVWCHISNPTPTPNISPCYNQKLVWSLKQDKNADPCTWDICGLRLISFRLMVWGLRLFSSWHSSTPSRRVCAKSNTCAASAVTRWFAGSTLQLISHIAHCLQYSMLKVLKTAVQCQMEKSLSLSWTRALHDRSRTQLRPLSSPNSNIATGGQRKAAAAYDRCSAGTGCRETPLCVNFPFLLLWYFLRGGRSSRELLNKYEQNQFRNRSAFPSQATATGA